MLLSGLVSLLKLFCMSQNSETTWEIYLHTCFCKIVSNKNPTVILAYPSLLYKYSKAVSWFCVDNVLFPPVTFTFFPQQSASLQSQQIILNIFSPKCLLSIMSVPFIFYLNEFSGRGVVIIVNRKAFLVVDSEVLQVHWWWQPCQIWMYLCQISSI